MATPNAQRLIFGLFLLIPILALEIVCGHLKVPAWPAFIAMIFFFVEHMDPKKAPSILVGGLFGILLVVVAGAFIKSLAPHLGVEGASLLFIVIAVYSIVAFGEMVPLLFNNYAFMYLTVSGVAARAGAPNPFLWMAIEAVGGAALIGSVIGIGKMMMAMASRRAA